MLEIIQSGGFHTEESFDAKTRRSSTDQRYFIAHVTGWILCTALRYDKILSESDYLACVKTGMLIDSGKGADFGRKTHT